MYSLIYFKHIFLIAIIVMLFVPALLFAQVGEFDWGNLGVNVAIIGSIIALTQIFKSYIPWPNLVIFVPIILSIGAFFLIAGDQPIENLFYWAAAAAYLWKMANKAGVLKSAEKK